MQPPQPIGLYGEVKTMNNRFVLSPYFRIERERTARKIRTVTARGFSLIPEMAAFIAAILAAYPLKLVRTPRP
jgi:hypothetical protein